MATEWIGGDPSEPDYYIYIRTVTVENGFWKQVLNRRPKSEEKESVSIITSSEYYQLNKNARSFYRGLTIGDVQKYGTKEMKAQLPEATARALGRAIGIPI